MARDEIFDSNIEELLVKKHHLDIESICEINKAELEELGLSIGHALSCLIKMALAVVPTQRRSCERLAPWPKTPKQYALLRPAAGMVFFKHCVSKIY